MKSTVRPLRFLAAAACLLAILSFAVDGDAATYVMVADEDMVDGAALIAVVSVTDREVVEVGGRIYTDFVVEPMRTLKGAARGAQLRVRRPGGILPDGRYTIIPGLPELRVGEQTLLFMIEREDGTYGFEHYLLGRFQLRTIEGRQVAYRLLDAPATHLDDPRRQHRRRSLELAHHARDMETFAGWIRDRVEGVERPGNYYLDEGFLARHPEPQAFTLFDDGSGNNFHRHEFSPGENGKTNVYLGGKGLKGISQKGKKSLKAALKAWTKVMGGKYKPKKKKSADKGLTVRDGFEAWIFDDPNDEIAGDYSCAVGGVLAVGGFQGATGPPHPATGSGNAKARAYWDILESDVVFQKGIDCFFQGRKKKSANNLIAEIGTHEQGHAHGIGHSCGDAASGPCNTNKKDDATMRALLHDDERGGKVRPDDEDAARALDYQGS